MSVYKKKIAEIVVEKIKTIMKEKCLNQTEVAEVLGWKQPQVSVFLKMNCSEKYFNKVSTDSLLNIAEAFKIKLDIKIK